MLGDGLLYRLLESLGGGGLFPYALATLLRELSVKLPACQAPSIPETP